MRSTHRILRLDGPGPSGFNERIHKKQVLPYFGSSQNYLFPCVSSKPNFSPTNIFGILVFKGSFWMSWSPCKANINWNYPKSSPVSDSVHPGFTFPSHQIYMPTIIFPHQLHNHTQIFLDFVLAQPFAALMNAITVKWFNHMEDMDWSVNKQHWDKMLTNWSSMAMTK